MRPDYYCPGSAGGNHVNSLPWLSTMVHLLLNQHDLDITLELEVGIVCVFCCVRLQLQVAHNELNTLRIDNSAATAAARKARKRAQQDCEAAIAEYDAELGARQKEYEQALTAYNELQEEIGVRVQPVQQPELA